MQCCCAIDALNITDAISSFIRVGNHWWVSDQLGKEGGYMRAEVGEADQRLPPLKGWEVYKPGKWISWKGEWSSEDQTLECSCHLEADNVLSQFEDASGRDTRSLSNFFFLFDIFMDQSLAWW